MSQERPKAQSTLPSQEKQRNEDGICKEGTLSEDVLQRLTTEELIKTVKILQDALHDSYKLRKVLSETTGNAANHQPKNDWTPAKIAERTSKVRELCSKEIKVVEVWTSSRSTSVGRGGGRGEWRV